MIIIPSDANLQQQLEKIGRPADLSGGTFVNLTRHELREQTRQPQR